jgi:hypothetical protein
MDVPPESLFIICQRARENKNKHISTSYHHVLLNMNAALTGILVLYPMNITRSLYQEPCITNHPESSENRSANYAPVTYLMDFWFSRMC